MFSLLASLIIEANVRNQLRDIFRIHPDTASNTHDLLECICENDEGLDPSVDQVDLDGHGDEPESPKGFISASQVKPQREVDKAYKEVKLGNTFSQFLAHEFRINFQYLDKKRSSLASLGEWKHINCLKPDAGRDVKDDLLRQMLFVRLKTDLPNTMTGTKTDQILAAVDLDNLAKMEAPTARTVPGGTVSFLFERSSSIVAVEEDATAEVEEEEMC